MLITAKTQINIINFFLNNKTHPEKRSIFVEITSLSCPNVFKTVAHLGFSEGRGPNFRKGANQYKTKKKRI